MQKAVYLCDNGFTTGKERVAAERDVPDGELHSSWRDAACCARRAGCGDGYGSGGGSAGVQVLDGSPDAFDHVCKRIVMCRPPADRFCVRREHLQFGEGSILPIGGAQENGNDAGLPGLVPGYGLVHLDIPAKG